ncbi:MULTISPECIES: class I SAM-dependent methyltransferase [Robiginitalea]|uniref:class I SAM-dependent methyltransferase n=1 Tax=Robiginitalea TaxID=252306 RepID=UPI002349849B|nr:MULTISPECIES: class I SAM-dependent methyltransferase [unclassified Robiginitalea]MDC6355729.1 class I SAM-dependent methyltransferase [Robiginitalea sp. PM2]MDC6376140.1 class I SAM-dependent methyltransferase [Robiginitalea sp. SP8]
MKYSELGKDLLFGEAPKEEIVRGHFLDFVHLIRDYFQKNNCKGKLLDFGCGKGFWSNEFSKIGFDVLGLDGSVDQIKQARSKYQQIDFIHFNFSDKLPLDDNSFDIIFSCSVFQYVNHDSVIKEFKRVLKENGKVIFLENLKYNPITSLGRLYLKLTKHKYQFYPWNHLTKSEIKKIGEEFDSPNYRFNHILSPLSYNRYFKRYYTSLFKLDQHLLKIKFLQKFTWLVLFTASNK